MREAKIKR